MPAFSRIGFVTYQGQPQLTADDRAAAEALERRGVSVTPVVWDQVDPAALAVDALVFRSCWDYPAKRHAFETWLEAVERTGIPALNPPEVIRWNLNKKYLLDLERLGAALPKTLYFESGSRPAYDELVAGVPSSRVVLKPAVSLNGLDTFRCDTRDRHGVENAARAILKGRDLIVQEYMPEIETTGETSLMFFNGEFSHCIRKTPRPGEFRVQEEHGGTLRPDWPDTGTLREASDLLRRLGKKLLYARVDGIQTRDRFVWMELEAIEPSLFFLEDPKSADRFARAVISLGFPRASGTQEP